MYLLNINVRDLILWNQQNGEPFFSTTDNTEGGLVIFATVAGPIRTVNNNYGIRVFGSNDIPLARRHRRLRRSHRRDRRDRPGDVRRRRLQPRHRERRCRASARLSDRRQRQRHIQQLLALRRSSDHRRRLRRQLLRGQLLPRWPEHPISPVAAARPRARGSTPRSSAASTTPAAATTTAASRTILASTRSGAARR